MGVLTAVNPSNLISVDSGGLCNTLGQIVDALRQHEKALQAHEERLDATEAMQHKAAAIDGHAALEKMSSRLRLIEEHHDQWADRFGKAEQVREESRADLELRLNKERDSREVLESCVRALESEVKQAAADRKSVDDLQTVLTADFQRNYQALEARVRVAEEKASECRREAKAQRERLEERELSSSEFQRKLKTACKDSQEAIKSSGHVRDLQRDASVLSETFEAQVHELDGRLREKADASVVGVMRHDLEMSSHVLQDAVKAVTQRLYEQESRLQSLEAAQARRSAAQDSGEHRGRSLPSATEALAKDECSHCLLCHNDRSLSPSRVAIGSDNLVYSHMARSAEPALECSSEPQLLSNLRASPALLQNIVRPRPTPPSIRQGPPHPWEVKTTPGTTAAAAVSLARKSSGVPRPGCDVKSRRISDLVAFEGSTLASSGSSSRPSSATLKGTVTPSTRPSSAQSQGDRGRKASTRPSSAVGAARAGVIAKADAEPSAGELTLMGSQSLPELEKKTDITGNL